VTPRPVRRPIYEDLARAAEVLDYMLPRTPVLRVSVPGVDHDVLVKLETVQPTGSFKVRGALAAVAAYRADGRKVVTGSAGNHGLGIAYAAARLDVPATVVVATTGSRAKIDALRELGADLVLHGENYEQAEAHALELADDGHVFVSPYNDPYVIAGQATCATEIADQVDGERTIVVPVGGGGLLAATAVHSAFRQGIRVVGVEAEASRGFSATLAAGRDVTVPVGQTLADGLAGNLEPGSISPGLVEHGLHSMVAVTEDEIAAAIRFLAVGCGLVVEGAGAVGIAALMAGKVPVAGKAVALLTGRNISADTLAAILRGSPVGEV
jgi:threonine dehydratase